MDLQKKKKRRDKTKDKDKEDRNKDTENAGSKAKKAYVPTVVTVAFAGNEYSGIIETDSTGTRSLQGAARYTFKSGIVYEGLFVGSHIEGRGKFTWPDGSSYEGEIINGKRHGEGFYAASDAVTRYEGQWVQGKRHGTGCIMYDLTGYAHYLGQWEDGWKHGDGRQVWPSGNVYEGQWKFGKMAGQGTMTWKHTGLLEKYTGNWEDDKPQGVGIQTWHAPEASANVAGFSGRPATPQGPSQQLNNRYHGEWNRGVRHGNGTFSYANGATYAGSWSDNVKHGQGKYTFEHGKVYSGPFTADQMKEYNDPAAGLASGALNIGAEDNPVRRCIDVSDLEIFALPPDVGEIDADTGSGYDESSEVMREVHNTLLRYLGELKQSYHQYRKIMPGTDCDPFVLSMHQVWIFARDLDLLTPLFNLSSFNRCVLSGPRHHQENATEEETQDVRPLTPRQDDVAVRKVSHSRASQEDGSETEPSAQRQSQSRLSNASKAGKDVSQVNASEIGTEASSRASSAVSSPRSTHESIPADPNDIGSQSNNDASPSPLSPLSPSPNVETAAVGTGEPPRSIVSPSVSALPHFNSKFWRRADAAELVDIHSSSNVMMFRHFLEIFVRVAVARFPNEKGLEQQVRRLFKETLAPRFGTHRGSETVFGFLLDPDISQVFNSFQPQLWALFKEHAVGDGVYGQPHWAPPPDTLDDSEAETIEKRNRAVNNQDAPGQKRTRRRGYGGQQRRVHVKARMDVTVRVKDFLHILNTAGILSPPGPREKYPPFLADSHSTLFTNMGADAGATPEPAPRGMTPIAELGGLAALMGHTADATPSPGPDAERQQSGKSDKVDDARERTTTDERSDAAETGGLPTSSQTASPDAPSGGAAEGSASPSGGAPAEATRTPDVEGSIDDFQFTCLEVLKLVSEVNCPDSAHKLCWAVKGEESEQDERVGVLDFVETELTFCEFQRLLLRISERKPEGADDASSLTLHERLQGFLKNVFLPSLAEQPLSKLEAEPSAEAPELDADADPDAAAAAAADAAAAEVAAADPATEEPAFASEAPASQLPTFNLWLGFDSGNDLHCQEELSAGRAWPEDYEAIVAAW